MVAFFISMSLPVQVVSDRVLEFDLSSFTDQLRWSVFDLLQTMQSGFPGWQPFLIADKLAMIHSESVQSPDEVQHLARIVESVLFRCTAFPERGFDTHVFEVQFGGELGPDLHRIARLNGLNSRQWVTGFLSGIYVVGFNGFLPGFSYLTGLDKTLSAPRLTEPRPMVKAGSLGIAEQYCAIYPSDSPGGWNLVGWVNRQVFSIDHEPPCLMMPGDRVTFVEAE